MLNFKEASHFSLTLSVEILILGFILMDSTWMVNCSKYMGGQSRRTDRRLGGRQCGDICNVFQALHNCITLHANSDDDDRFLAIGFPITSAANFQSLLSEFPLSSSCPSAGLGKKPQSGKV